MLNSIRLLSASVAALALCAAPATATPAPATPAVAVDAPWVAAPAPGSTALAGYMTLKNQGTTPLVLKGFSSPLFESVEAHENMVHGGMTHMHALGAITLGPGASRAFVAGGDHLMLMRPRRPIQPGDAVPVTLDFGAAGKLTTTFPVHTRATAPSPAAAASTAPGPSTSPAHSH